MSGDDIVREFLDYMRKNGGSPRDWYVGISDDAPRRLFNEHHVNEQGDAWIHAPASSSESARDVENHFINVVGTDGGGGGGDQYSNKVYAYKKNGHTDP